MPFELTNISPVNANYPGTVRSANSTFDVTNPIYNPKTTDATKSILVDLTKWNNQSIVPPDSVDVGVSADSNRSEEFFATDTKIKPSDNVSLTRALSLVHRGLIDMIAAFGINFRPANLGEYSKAGDGRGILGAPTDWRAQTYAGGLSGDYVVGTAANSLTAQQLTQKSKKPKRK